MSKQHKNREDDFLYDCFKDNLENFSLPVDEQCWENISQHITRKKTPLYLRSAFAGLVAAALIVVVLVFVLNTDFKPKKGTSLVATNSSTFTESNEDNESIDFDKIDKEKADKEIYESPQSNLNKQSRQYKNYVGPNIDNSETSELTEYNTQTLKTENTTKQKGGEVEKNNTKNKKYDNLYAINDRNLDLLASNLKEDAEWEIAAAVASNVSSSSTRQNHMGISTAPLFNNSVLGPTLGSGSITDVKYAPPISIGLTVRKNINRYIGVESGLYYSLLSTSYKDAQNNANSATLKLHYVGIPVNLVVNIWNKNPHFKIYGTTGIMLEKGLRSSFSQHIADTKQNIKLSDKIKGVQWSLNASIGISYNFYQKWNIYLEPRLSYYLKNNQPLSIRTEKRKVIGINAGFRYEF